MAAVIVHSDFGTESKKIKSVTASTFPPFICHEVMGLSLHSFIELCKPLPHDKAVIHEGVGI